MKGERRLKRQAKKKMRSELLAELISRTTWRHVAGAPILRFHFARISFHSQNWLKPSSFVFFFFHPWRNRWCVCVCIFHIKQSPIALAAWNFFSSWKEKLVIIDWWRNIKKGEKRPFAPVKKATKWRRGVASVQEFTTPFHAQTFHTETWQASSPFFFFFLLYWSSRGLNRCRSSHSPTPSCKRYECCHNGERKIKWKNRERKRKCVTWYHVMRTNNKYAQ